MAGSATTFQSSANAGRRSLPALRDPALVRWLLVAISLGFLGAVLFLPLVAVFAQAFANGIPAYLAALRHPDTRAAIALTLTTAAVAVPLNALIGICAALLSDSEAVIPLIESRQPR